MRASIRSSNISGLAGAVAALWLYGAGAAWAGGGMDLGSLQALLSGPPGEPQLGFCAILKMNSCTTLPTVTQAVLQVAALTEAPPDAIRAQNNIAPGSSVTAGNAAVTSIALDPAGLSSLLSTLTPLAFISQSSGTAPATPLYDTTADAFLYAVAVGPKGATGLPSPKNVYFIYDDLFRNGQTFNKNQLVAQFSFPLTVLSKDAMGNFHETPVPITLQFIATSAGDCSASTVSGQSPPGSPVTVSFSSSPASQIGINCAVVFGTSPTSAQTHAILWVEIPLLVTGATPPPNTDPPYFYSRNSTPVGLPGPINTAVFSAFLSNDLGTPLNPPGIFPSIGLAPTAAPLEPQRCTLDPNTNIITCSGGAAKDGETFYGLCASLPTNGNGQPIPAVAAFYSVTTSGETLLSAPFPLLFQGLQPQGNGKPTITCPF